LRQIRDLKERGYSLRMVERELQGGARRPQLEVGEETLSLPELADRSGVPPAVLRSLEASGVIRPRRFGDKLSYTTADVRAVRMLLSLLGGGLPMEEFMRVAHVQLEAAEGVAKGAVDLFMTYVREPLRSSGLSQKEEAERVIAALRLMIHATTALMTYSFQRTVLNAAQEAIERDGSKAERAALRREVVRRRIEMDIPA
jgi:DNA-binding transcriptional MerR regulator